MSCRWSRSSTSPCPPVLIEVDRGDHADRREKSGFDFLFRGAVDGPTCGGGTQGGIGVGAGACPLRSTVRQTRAMLNLSTRTTAW